MGTLMTRHFYRERDHAFGQAMFKLRSSIGLTQAGLADLLGVSRRAVGEWERADATASAVVVGETDLYVGKGIESRVKLSKELSFEFF